MKIKELQEQINKIDIYLLDQILKGRYEEGTKILDAGCGKGRNIELFLKNDFTVYGVDKDVALIKSLNDSAVFDGQYQVAGLDNLPFKNDFFDHIICNAVLHFAGSTNHFYEMFQELIRVLKPKGTLFIRMTSIFGIENDVQLLGDGVYKIPDGSTRFLLDKNTLEKLESEYNLTLIEPLKTVNVNNVRCMSNLLLLKE